MIIMIDDLEELLLEKKAEQEEERTVIDVSEFIDTEDVLRAYQILLSNVPVRFVDYDKELTEYDVLCDGQDIAAGLNSKFLPETINYLRNYGYLNCTEDVEPRRVVVSYKFELDWDFRQDHWESKGFETKKVKRSLEVLSDGVTFAKFGKNRVIIREDYLTTYINNM